MSACRFSSAPSGELQTPTDASVSVDPSPALAGRASAPAVAAQTASATQATTTAPATDAAVSSVATQPKADPDPKPSAAVRPAATTAAVAMADADAGAAEPPADSGAPTVSDSECSAELAACLLKDPLNYAECLRMNAEHGCPEPDAGTATTSPVTSEDGKPLSSACQAELANCIMRNPTPSNAEACTQTARKCKP